MPDTASVATGTLEEATNAFAGYLAAESGNETPPQEQVAQVPEQAPAESEAETAPAEAQAEAEAAEGEAPTEEGEAQEADPAKVLLTVTIDGKQEQISAEEAAKGYQRQADYSRKTAALAEQRRAFESKAAEVAQRDQQYAQLIPALIQRLQATQPKAPDETLLNSDPVEYVRQKEIWRSHQEQLGAAELEQRRIQHLQAQEQQQAIQKQVEEGSALLSERIPEWKDPAKQAELKAKLLAYGQTVGWSKEDLQQAYDPRAILVLDKARRYDELMAKPPKPVVQASPKPAPAGASGAVPRSQNEAQREMNRLKATGRQSDAVSLMQRHLLNGG